MFFSKIRLLFVLFVAVAAAGSLTGCETGESIVSKLVHKAETGDAAAMLQIAEIYCGGMNIEQDDQVCSIWLKRASEFGSKRAQFMLGGMYELGLGVRPDYVQAYRWYMLSALQEYGMAGAEARRLRESMSQSQLNEAQKQIDDSIASNAVTGRYFVIDPRIEQP